MEGYLTQLLGENVEELYWSPEQIDEQLLKAGYKDFENQEDVEDFEEWWNNNLKNTEIERVFVDEIYI